MEGLSATNHGDDYEGGDVVRVSIRSGDIGIPKKAVNLQRSHVRPQIPRKDAYQRFGCDRDRSLPINRGCGQESTKSSPPWKD